MDFSEKTPFPKDPFFPNPSVASGVDTEFPYRVRIVDRGVDCRDPVCCHRFRFPALSEISKEIPCIKLTKEILKTKERKDRENLYITAPTTPGRGFSAYGCKFPFDG